MEFLILVGGIAVIIFIFSLIFKYREGRNAVLRLAKMEDGVRQLQKIHISLKEEIHCKENEIAQWKKTTEGVKNLHKTLLDTEKRTSQGRIVELERAIEKKDNLYKSFEKSEGSLFSKLASLLADFKTIQYDISEKYLVEKKHPAIVEAHRINELKKQTKEIIEKNKIAQYKYEYLFTLFPDLEIYVDNAEELNELSQFDNLDDFQSNVDRTKRYLSDEEYKNLSEEDRNQLALNRYVKNQKSKWEIGRDYELYVGYTYSSEGWDVEYFGIEKQLNDMGRDLIAKKDGVVHIIQCKYWAQRKIIHEKHIAQLFGTTIQYELSGTKAKKVVPVFVTNITLSDTAREFSEYLGVKYIEGKDFKDFPRIKCNVNRDEHGETKIYHLPIDQQYDRTKISAKGDFFAYTVKEAMNKGFRRAHRWYGNE
jgi:hypothetical protein